MADITNEEALAFSQEHLRPLAEMLTWLQATGNNTKALWDGGKNTLFTNAQADPILDNNASRHPYHSQNANTIMARLTSILAILNAANAMDDVLPATVRSLSPSSGPGG